MIRLPCGCVPTAYDGGSTTLVHGFGCAEHPEGTKLTGAEVALTRGHPAAKPPPATLRPAPEATYTGRPRRTREVWHNGPNHCRDCVGVE